MMHVKYLSYIKNQVSLFPFAISLSLYHMMIFIPPAPRLKFSSLNKLKLLMTSFQSNFYLEFALSDGVKSRCTAGKCENVMEKLNFVYFTFSNIFIMLRELGKVL